MKPKRRPRFPKAWRYYPTVVASLAAAVITLNAFLVSTEGDAQAWISAAIAVTAATLITIRGRARQLGIKTNGVDETAEAEAETALGDAVADAEHPPWRLRHLLLPRHGGHK
jgi:hypothetical protein